MPDPLDLSALRRAAEEAIAAGDAWVVGGNSFGPRADRLRAAAESLRRLATPEAILALVGRVEALEREAARLGEPEEVHTHPGGHDRRHWDSGLSTWIYPGQELRVYRVDTPRPARQCLVCDGTGKTAVDNVYYPDCPACGGSGAAPVVDV